MIWERVPYPDHPNRCQALRGQQGQCINMAMDGSQYCPAHGGNQGAGRKASADRTLYEANKYLNIHSKRDNSALLSLTMEVAALKSLIEARLKLIKDDHSYIMHTPVLGDMIMKSEKLVSSCIRLQEKLDNILTADQALQFAEDIQTAIREEVKDVQTVQRLKDRIDDLISSW